jgi:hypothetical protein
MFGHRDGVKRLLSGLGVVALGLFAAPKLRVRPMSGFHHTTEENT